MVRRPPNSVMLSLGPFVELDKSKYIVGVFSVRLLRVVAPGEMVTAPG